MNNMQNKSDVHLDVKFSEVNNSSIKFNPGLFWNYVQLIVWFGY